MNKTAVPALDLSPAAEPLLECTAELRRWGAGRLVIGHAVRMGYGQEPGAPGGHRRGLAGGSACWTLIVAICLALGFTLVEAVAG